MGSVHDDKAWSDQLEREKLCGKIEQLQKLLLSCRMAMEHSQLHGGVTDWSDMIAAINQQKRTPE